MDISWDEFFSVLFFAPFIAIPVVLSWLIRHTNKAELRRRRLPWMDVVLDGRAYAGAASPGEGGVVEGGRDERVEVKRPVEGEFCVVEFTSTVDNVSLWSKSVRRSVSFELVRDTFESLDRGNWTVGLPSPSTGRCVVTAEATHLEVKAEDTWRLRLLPLSSALPFSQEASGGKGAEVLRYTGPAGRARIQLTKPNKWDESGHISIFPKAYGKRYELAPRYRLRSFETEARETFDISPGDLVAVAVPAGAWSIEVR